MRTAILSALGVLVYAAFVWAVGVFLARNGRRYPVVDDESAERLRRELAAQRRRAS